MTLPRLAIIDLGTNTFHILIVEATSNSWSEVYRERIFVNLAQDGIEHICLAARKRGVRALQQFAKVIADQRIGSTMAVGTAALRRADNSDQFIREVKRKLGIEISVIDGQREAEYINQGVMQAMPDNQGNCLIMDIGGGSVEFILSSSRKPVFSVSYPIGVAVLYDKFHKSEPIADNEIKAISQFLMTTMQDLTEAVGPFSELSLIGASGTFEVIDAAMQGQQYVSPFSIIQKQEVLTMYDEVLPMTYSERKQARNIPETRAQYIVVALKLIEHVLNNYPISEVGVSQYALKEGIASAWRSNLDTSKFIFS